MSRFAALAFVLSVIALPNALSAQQRTIPAGARVRVAFVRGAADDTRASRDGNSLVGALIDADDTSLVVMPPGRSRTEYRVPLARAARLDVYEGKVGTHARRGALTGLFVGAVGGFLFGVTAQTECECPAALGGISGLVFGLGGLVVGATAGSVIPRERWRAVPLPVRIGPRS